MISTFLGLDRKGAPQEEPGQDSAGDDFGDDSKPSPKPAYNGVAESH